MNRRAALLLLLGCGACGRSVLLTTPPRRVADLPDAADGAVSADGSDGSAPDAFDPDDGVETGADARVEAGARDAGFRWEAGVPVESMAVSTAQTISAVATPTSVLAGVRNERGDQVVAFDFGGVEHDVPRTMLPTNPGDSEISPTPWLAWNGDHGVAAASFVGAGCEVQPLDEAADRLGAPVSTGAVACERLRARPDGGWDGMIFGLLAPPSQTDRVRLDASYRVVDAPDPLAVPMGYALGSYDRSSLDDGTELLAMLTGPSGARPQMDLFTFPRAAGASASPVIVAPSIPISAAPFPRVLGVGTHAWVVWGEMSSAAGVIAIVDTSGAPVGVPILFADGAAQRPQGCALDRVHDDVFLVWTGASSTVADLHAQTFHPDGAPGGEVVLTRLPAVGQPEVVVTPVGALVLFLAAPSGAPPYHLYAQPIYYYPAP